MDRFPGLDPEVLADLRDRERSAHDPTRARRARNPFADVAKVEHVEHWPCRGGCGRMIGITAEAAQAFAILSAELVAQGKRPLAKVEAVACPACKRAEDERRQAERPQQQHMAGMGPAGKGRP